MATLKNQRFFVPQKSKISAESKNSNDKKATQIFLRELKHFEELIKGHKKLLYAIGNL